MDRVGVFERVPFEGRSAESPIYHGYRLPRAGIGATVPHVESVVDGRRRERYEIAGAAVHASGGMEMRLWRRLSATAEIKWTGAGPRVTLAEGVATLTARSRSRRIRRGVRVLSAQTS